MVFRFKQFSVNHGSSSMRVGTDAVLLGAWAQVKENETILEIGTGCGIIALMMAQKSRFSSITAIDIHTESVEEAKFNFKNSTWSERLLATKISLHELASQSNNRFSHIICNPPFFIDSTPAPVLSRHNARHADTLLPEGFFEDASKLLTDQGKVSLIIPDLGSERWLSAASDFKLYLGRKTAVHAYPGKVAERLLLEFSFQPAAPIISEVFIREGKGLGYTNDYKQLTHEFYL
jgi:tRNA1Val (adenine37-N6)-methyltransferase